MIANVTQKRLCIAILPFALLNAACTPQRVRTALPPADLLTCADEPQAPSIPSRDGTDATQFERDRMTLAYILGLRSAWGDCAAKVAGVRAWAGEVE